MPLPRPQRFITCHRVRVFTVFSFSLSNCPMGTANRRPKQRPKQSLPPPFLYEDIRLSGRGFRIFRCSPIDEADHGANDFMSITTLGGAFGVPLADPEWLIRENKWCNISFDLSRYHKPGASQVGFVPWMVCVHVFYVCFYR